MLLSAYSNFFKTLFFGEFREKDQDEIELKEVCAEQFLHLLKVVYPPLNDTDVNQNNVESLLRLAERYHEVSLEEKLLYAQDYHFLELLEHCVQEYKTVNDVKKLRASGHILF
uniref:BTB domain-containing protein n=1 Tax=Ditylenchus dipsaci TaxID=166011 RepID=A0A915DFG2_9BILA